MAVRLFAFFVSDLAVRKRAGPDLTCETLHFPDRDDHFAVKRGENFLTILLYLTYIPKWGYLS